MSVLRRLCAAVVLCGCVASGAAAMSSESVIGFQPGAAELEKPRVIVGALSKLAGSGERFTFVATYPRGGEASLAEARLELMASLAEQAGVDSSRVDTQLQEVEAPVGSSASNLVVIRIAGGPSRTDTDGQSAGGEFPIKEGSLRANLERLVSSLGYDELVWVGNAQCLDWQVHSDYALAEQDGPAMIESLVEGYPLTVDLHKPDRVAAVRTTLHTRCDRGRHD